MRILIQGPPENNPIVHGWTTKDILYNHSDYVKEKVKNNPSA
jgi:hypothetical protein